MSNQGSWNFPEKGPHPFIGRFVGNYEDQLFTSLESLPTWKKYDDTKQLWLSRFKQQETPQTHPGVPQLLLPEDDVLVNAALAKISVYIFSAFPLRILKLPEKKLTERRAVERYIIQNKSNDLAKKIREEMDKQEQEVAFPPGPRNPSDLQDAAVSAVVRAVCKFAVLSHAWGHDEPSHDDLVSERNVTDSQGYKKLDQFCRIAREEYNIEFAWADTVCIDKRSSSELDESIRSMFTWYRESSICIIHLAETETLLDFPFDRWFSRGWTLQELLAALKIKFYNKHWKPLTSFSDEKASLHTGLLATDDRVEDCCQLKLLADGISIATGIPIKYIRNFYPGLRDPSFPERMKWIAGRKTTRPEDISYAMMGMLGVSISVAYGEGMERAFFRLFQSVLQVDWSPDWFLWGGKPISRHIHPSRMIPSSPACYLSWDPKCLWDPSSGPPFRLSPHILTAPVSALDIYESRKKDTISLTTAGLLLKVLVVPARSSFGQSVDISCPLSNNTTSISLDTADYFLMLRSQFALAVLNYDWPPGSTPKRIYAKLLYRTLIPFNWRVEGMPLRCMCQEWQKCPQSEEILSFYIKDKFREMDVDDWTTIKITASEVGWDGSGQDHAITCVDTKGNPVVPKIEFQTLYL